MDSYKKYLINLHLFQIKGQRINNGTAGRAKGYYYH